MRLFIAIRFDDGVLDELEGFIAQCRRLGRGRWTRRDNLHLTLAFLGEQRDTAAAEAAMDGLSAPAFDLTLAGLGRFRREGGDLLWLGAEPSAPLLTAERQLRQGLKRQGFSPEERPFRPHLTLGRQVSLPAPPPAPTLTQRVEGVSLMESRREAGVLTYTELYWRRLG